MAAEKILEIWAKRNPEWETKYEDTIIKVFCNYGKGTTSYQETRAKKFGAGYEIFIIAFFIGLYFNKTKELVADKSKRKSFGWAIENWGNIESRSGRKQYSRIREYMFMALVAKTEVDWIALDKGEITSRKVVDLLIDKMEQYANYGFDYIADKLEDNPDHFFKDRALLNEIIKFMISSEDVKTDNNDDEEAESLD